MHARFLLSFDDVPLVLHCMTWKGTIEAMNRHGMSNLETSPMFKAAFEKNGRDDVGRGGARYV